LEELLVPAAALVWTPSLLSIAPAVLDELAVVEFEAWVAFVVTAVVDVDALAGICRRQGSKDG
jgi:hypothetical protein